MANEISKLTTPDGVSHDIKDAVARQASYDVSNKVDKAGDTMTGNLKLESGSNNGIIFKESGYGDKFEIKPSFSGTEDRITNKLCFGYVESGQTNNNLKKFMNFDPTNGDGKVTFGTDGTVKSYIDLNNGYYSGKAANSDKWNGITLDMNTSNTTDTWVPVQTGSTWQHRVIPTDYNDRIIGDSNHAASTGAALSSDTGRIGVHWYSQTGKISNQPAQYGFLLTCATAKGAAEQHSIFMEQANGNLYHMGTNGSSSGSPPSYKKLWDSGNAPYGSVSFTRSHASVSYQEGLVCYRFGNVVTFAGYFSCGATIAANTTLYSGLPKPAGGKHIYFTWSGYDFFLNASDGTIRTNGQIVSRTYVGTFTYICA